MFQKRWDSVFRWFLCESGFLFLLHLGVSRSFNLWHQVSSSAMSVFHSVRLLWIVILEDANPGSTAFDDKNKKKGGRFFNCTLRGFFNLLGFLRDLMGKHPRYTTGHKGLFKSNESCWHCTVRFKLWSYFKREAQTAFWEYTFLSMCSTYGQMQKSQTCGRTEVECRGTLPR